MSELNLAAKQYGADTYSLFKLLALALDEFDGGPQELTIEADHFEAVQPGPDAWTRLQVSADNLSELGFFVQEKPGKAVLVSVDEKQAAALFKMQRV